MLNLWPDTLLHPIKGYNRYCGPGVLSALLGITTDEAAKRIRQKCPHMQMVRSSPKEELCEVLEDGGWKLIGIPPYVKTLETLDREIRHYEPGLYLVVITHHYLIGVRYKGFTGWLVVDNQNKDGKTLALYKNRNRRIDEMFYLVSP